MEKNRALSLENHLVLATVRGGRGGRNRLSSSERTPHGHRTKRREQVTDKGRILRATGAQTSGLEIAVHFIFVLGACTNCLLLLSHGWHLAVGGGLSQRIAVFELMGNRTKNKTLLNICDIEVSVKHCKV